MIKLIKNNQEKWQYGWEYNLDVCVCHITFALS